MNRWTPSVAWTALILALTSIPGPDVPQVGPAWIDKVMHFSLYGVLGFLVTRALLRGPGAGRLGWLVWRALPPVALFAALDEIHQLWIPGRDADPHDWLADVCGAAIAILLTAAAALARREPST